MPNTWKFVAAWSAIGILLAAGGCGNGGEGNTESDSAEINNGAATPPSTSSQSPAAEPIEADADPSHPVVLIKTSMGDITVRLDAEEAYVTVDNFLRYVDSGHYDDTIFHQVLKDYVILGGAYTIYSGAGSPEQVEKPTRTSIYNEASNGLKNLRGTIAMARQPDDMHSATCQFFFNLTDNPMLDHKDHDTAEGYGYCVFGEVIEGMDVVDRIADVEVTDTEEFERIPIETVLINSIRRIR